MRNQDLNPSVSVLKPPTLFYTTSPCSADADVGWVFFFFFGIHPNESLEMTSKKAYGISALRECLRSAVWNSFTFSDGIDVEFKMCQAIANYCTDVNSSSTHQSEAVGCCYYYFQWGNWGTSRQHRANKVQIQVSAQSALLLSLCFLLYRLHPWALYSHVVTCPGIWQ